MKEDGYETKRALLRKIAEMVSNKAGNTEDEKKALRENLDTENIKIDDKVSPELLEELARLLRELFGKDDN